MLFTLYRVSFAMFGASGEHRHDNAEHDPLL